MSIKILTFPTPKKLDLAYREAIRDHCRTWIPLLEESIITSGKLIEQYAKEVSQSLRVMNTQKFLLIFWERRQMHRKMHLLNFLKDQMRRLQRDEELPMTLAQFEDEKAKKNPSIC